MKRINFMIEQEQYKALINLPGNMSNNIRKSITSYIQQYHNPTQEQNKSYIKQDDYSKILEDNLAFYQQQIIQLQEQNKYLSMPWYHKITYLLQSKNNGP